jgi:hypothetical protein
MERPNGDNKFIIHVAAVSCAATTVPEKRLANQILRKTPFRQALGIEFILIEKGAASGMATNWKASSPLRRQSPSAASRASHYGPALPD